MIQLGELAGLLIVMGASGCFRNPNTGGTRECIETRNLVEEEFTEFRDEEFMEEFKRRVLYKCFAGGYYAGIFFPLPSTIKYSHKCITYSTHKTMKKRRASNPMQSILLHKTSSLWLC